MLACWSCTGHVRLAIWHCAGLCEICTCTYMHTYMHTDIHMYIYIHIHIPIHIHMCTYVSIFLFEAPAIWAPELALNTVPHHIDHPFHVLQPKFRSLQEQPLLQPLLSDSAGRWFLCWACVYEDVAFGYSFPASI